MTHVCFINNNIIIAHTSFFIQLNIIMQSLEDNQSILKIFPYFVIETHRASAILQKKNKYNIYPFGLSFITWYHQGKWFFVLSSVLPVQQK